MTHAKTKYIRSSLAIIKNNKIMYKKRLKKPKIDKSKIENVKIQLLVEFGDRAIKCAYDTVLIRGFLDFLNVFEAFALLVFG